MKRLSCRRITNIAQITWIIILCICCRAADSEVLKIGVDAMAPRLFSGDNVKLKRLTKSEFASLERGTVIAYRGLGPLSFGRIIGLPSDVIEIKANDVRVNHKSIRSGSQLAQECHFEKLANSEASKLRFICSKETVGDVTYNVIMLDVPAWSADDSNWGPRIVPKMHYFILGDNRYASTDSRHLGFISEDNIIGKVEF